jgi:hypothetical protein
MKRIVTALILTGIVAYAANAVGDKSHSHANEKAKTTAIQGEIVDLGCYVAHGARGEKHKSCAAKCLAGGMPMGLLTTKSKLYLLTLNHDNADPYTKAKGLAGAQVEVTGTLAERDGISALDVVAVRALTPAATK